MHWKPRQLTPAMWIHIQCPIGAVLMHMGLPEFAVCGHQVVALELLNSFNCCPVFLGEELTRKYYQGAWNLDSLHGRACGSLQKLAHCCFALVSSLEHIACCCTPL